MDIQKTIHFHLQQLYNIISYCIVNNIELDDSIHIHLRAVFNRSSIIHFAKLMKEQGYPDKNITSEDIEKMFTSFENSIDKVYKTYTDFDFNKHKIPVVYEN